MNKRKIGNWVWLAIIMAGVVIMAASLVYLLVLTPSARTGDGYSFTNDRITVVNNGVDLKKDLDVVKANLSTVSIDEEHRFAVINVTVSNIGSEALSIDPYYWMVGTSDGGVYAPLSVYKLLQGVDGYRVGILPGFWVNSLIIFQVEKGASIDVIMYDDGITHFSIKARM
ncbi:MAG: DUF4352 domain-containing protein [Sphaerochaeta sp.]|jgi:hypothetical protein|nr:DUF4352 domain-containing protein [Sphaerochaeta sp.]